MTYALKVIHPNKLSALALKSEDASNVKKDPEFVVIQPLPSWQNVFAFFERPDAELRRSTLSMALYFLMDREVSGFQVVEGLSCKTYLLDKIFIANFLKLCVKDKGILSIAFTILNSLHDKGWINSRDQLANNLELINGTDAYEVLKHADRIPLMITKDILKMDLLSHDFDLRHTVRSQSPILLRKNQFDIFLGRIQRMITAELWKRNDKRVSSRSFDCIFEYYNKPTIFFEENVLILMSKLEKGEKSHFLDDLFDYLTDKLGNGLTNPSDYKILNENHLRRLQKLAGIHSYDLIEKTSSILAEVTNDPTIRTLIQNRIQFWSIFKDQFLSIRIFLNKDLIEQHEVFWQRKDLKKSLTYSVYVIKFENFWFVQYLDKKPGVTYGFYFHKDNLQINMIFNLDVFSKETVKLIRKHADMYTKHGPDWQNHVAQHLENTHGFKIGSKHKYLLNPARKPGGELVDNDLLDWKSEY